jgi:L-histidine N-alpha-methyltransferase
MSGVDTMRLVSAHADVATFAREVQYYLSLLPRQLPSRYLYDALGSALFEAICELPWYPITRAERQLIGLHRRQILAMAGDPCNIVELGSGSGDKLALLLQDAQAPCNIHLVDVSRTALDSAERRLAEIDGLVVVTHHDRYEEGLQSVARAQLGRESMLTLFLGSNIGNFDQPAVQVFLANVRQSLCRDDMFLVGVDLIKPEPALLTAYDDPLGVTAAFNKNLLVRLNTELGASFDLKLFEHRAVWNAAESRVEMHLESRVRQEVKVPRADLTLAFEPGERIWTESSYKYDPGAFETLLGHAGFVPITRWIDERNQFLLLLCQVS